MSAHVRVQAANLLGEEGGGFAISQARSGLGRIHHCMRTIGTTERALESMVDRSFQRSTFGPLLAQAGLVHRVSNRDRNVSGVAAADCAPHGRDRKQDCGDRDLRSRAERGATSDRSCYSGAWCCWCDPRHPACGTLGTAGDASNRRWARSPQDDDRTLRDPEAGPWISVRRSRRNLDICTAAVRFTLTEA